MSKGDYISPKDIHNLTNCTEADKKKVPTTYRPFNGVYKKTAEL